MSGGDGSEVPTRVPSIHALNETHATAHNPHSNNNDNGTHSKRRAAQGQWQTPPLPIFPASSSKQQQPQQPQQQQQQAMPLPRSTDDYALALQEAYRRGAAAALNHSSTQQQQQESTPSTTMTGTSSFVPFSAGTAPSPVIHTTGTTTAPTSATAPSLADSFPNATSYPNLAQLQIQQQQQQQQQHASLTNRVGEEPDPQMITAQQQQAQQQQSYVASLAPAPVAPTTYMGPLLAPAPPQHAHSHVPVAPTNVSVTTNSSGIHPKSTTRSVSLPDMASYAAHANDEEQKRRKRLARNRASARLRRLRKKNLVDSYEKEVEVLETSLAKLKAHQWGQEESKEAALLEALSMERGQQSIAPERRSELIRSILEQQREQVQNIAECQLENMVLGWVASQQNEDGDGMVEVEKNEEEDMLAKELNEILKLTPDQRVQLQRATEGTQEERRAVETVDACLRTMMENEWLVAQGVQDMTDQLFTSILNPSQVSKFLLWTDTNAEAIDQLDYVHAPPPDVMVNAPTFCFGMEDGHHADDESEK